MGDINRILSVGGGRSRKRGVNSKNTKKCEKSEKPFPHHTMSWTSGQPVLVVNVVAILSPVKLTGN